MSNAYANGAILYEIETLHGEALATYATLQVPLIGMVDCSALKQDKVDSQRTTGYRQGGSQYILGVQGGSFKTKLWLTGHGSTTSGATTATALETLLGYVFGNCTISAATGTTTTAGTAVAPTTVGSGTFGAGSLARIGVIGDAKGNGQFVAVSTHVTTTLNLLTAIDGVPGASDVVFSAANIYPSENPTSTTVQPLRFQLQTANMVYSCHGCYPLTLAISGLQWGEVPTIEIEWGVSWFTEAGSITFPNNSVAQFLSNPAANAAGSIFVNDVGTATRVKRASARNLTITYKLGMAGIPGPGGFSQFQAINAARRLNDVITVSWTEDASAQSATPPMVTDATGTTYKHVLASMSAVAGSALGFYFPQIAITERPIQFSDNGRNSFRFTGEAITGPTTTSDLTLSAMRMAFA